MVSDADRALTPAEEAAAYHKPDYEDLIRQGGRIGDSRRRGQDELERWSQDVLANLGKWATELQNNVKTALATQAEAILTLEARVHELELKDRSRDEYEAEMRDRG